MAKDDNKEYQRELKAYNAQVNKAEAKESEGRHLTNEQKKNKAELQKLLKTRTKLYDINESKDRQFQAQKMQEYSQFTEKDLNAWDPYDNTPSSKKSGTAALGYAAQAQTNNLLERILKSQDNNPFNASLLNLQQQQVTLLGVISENIKAMRGVMAPTNKADNRSEYKEYEYGVSDTAKFLAALRFDKAAGSYMKAVGSKLDSTGEIGMAVMALDQFRSLAKDGGIYKIIKESIAGSIKSTILGSKNAKEWDRMKEDPASYIQEVINKAAGSKNAGIRALAEPLYTTNKIDLQRKMNKTDWSAGAKFDNKFYKSVIGSFETLREILGAIKGTKTTQFDWESETYRTESEIYLRQIAKNEDKLKNVRRNFKNELASIMEEMANDPAYASFARNNLQFNSNGSVKRDIHGNAQWTSDKIIKYVEKYIQSTGGRFDNLGDDLSNIVKSMGIDISDPNQAGIARQAMEILGMLRNYYRTATYASKERMNDMGSGFRDLHGRNTYNQIDNRIGAEAIQTLQALHDSGVNDPKQLREILERVDLDVSLAKGGGFGGNGGGASFTGQSTFKGYNNAMAYLNKVNAKMTPKQRYKTNKEAAKILQGEWVEEPMNVAKEFDLRNLSNKDKAEELRRAGRLNDNYYNLVMGNSVGNAIDTRDANNTVEREFKKYEACIKLYEIIHRAGATAQAQAAKHGGSVSKYKSQGYVSSPVDLMDCVDDNGKPIQSKMAKLGWGFISDTYIANESRRQREEDAKYKMDGNVVQNTNKLLSSVWQDSSIQKKLRIGGGTAVGLAIGSMMKNKGIISSNAGVYAMGAIGAGVMMTERAKKAIDMMYGPDSDVKGEHGFSNRDIGMAKLAQKIIPAAAAATVGGKTFMFSQRIFNSMGPVAGLVGFIPSLGAALAAGGITYKLLPALRKKIQGSEDGKGIFGKIKTALKGNKTIANIFGLSGERSNAAIYADNIDPIIKELEVNIAKLRQENPYDVNANLMEDNLRALKNYQYQLKSIDKDTRMKIEDKNSQASQIYDGIINLIKDQQKELFLKRTASDIDARDKAKDGINAANLNMVDHEARRAKDNIDQYNSAKTTGLTEMTKSSFRNKESYAREGSEAWAQSKYKTSYGNVQEARKTFNTLRGKGKRAVQGRTNFMAGKKDDFMNYFKKSDPMVIEKELRLSGFISDEVKFNDDNEFMNWLSEHEDAVYQHHIDKGTGTLNNYITAQMDLKFGKELANVFRSGMIDDSFFNRFSKLVKSNSATGKNMDELAKSGEAHEKAELVRQAKIVLGYTDKDGNPRDNLTKEEAARVASYVASRYFERNLQNNSIRLDPKVLQNAMKDNRIFDWMNGKTDDIGIPGIKEFLKDFEHIDSKNTNVVNSMEFRQMFGGWLIRQAYMAGLSNSGHLDAKSYNELFENILKEYVVQANDFKNSNYKKKLDNLMEGNTSLTDKYHLDGVIGEIQDIYKTEKDPVKRAGIVNSLLIDQYANKNLSGEDFGDIIGGQYIAGEEFNKLVALRRAIIKNPDGSDIPDEKHKEYIMDKINSMNSKGFFGRLMNRFGIRFLHKLNGMNEEDVADEKIADKVLIHALTNMYNTGNLSATPYYKQVTSKGSDGVTQYNWVQDGTIGSRAPKFPTAEELRDIVKDNFSFNMDKYAFGSGAGYGSDTANANMYSSKGSTLKMSDLSGYSFSNGAHLETFGCSIAAANNALVILKVPTLSKETMINVANQYLDKYGIKYGFFTHVANMLGLKSEILMANGNRFNKEFFNRLNFNNATYIALLDNIGHDSGAHYINILSISGDNVSINDPMQSGLNDLSISEITARASLIIKYDASNVSSTVTSIDSSINARQLNVSGSGVFTTMANTAMMSIAKNYVKNNGFNGYGGSEPSGGMSSDEGKYDPEVAMIATNVSDEKQKQGILSFIASSKNKAFAAAANRFRSLLSKPEVRSELKEKQNVADTQEQQGKDIAEMKDAIVGGKLGGGTGDGSGNVRFDGSGGMIQGLTKLVFGKYVFGKLFKWIKKKFGKDAVKETGEEVAEKTVQETAETAGKKMAGEGMESAFETGGREVIEEFGENSAKKVAGESVESAFESGAREISEEVLDAAATKAVKKTGQEVAESATKEVLEEGGKAASKGMIKGVRKILQYIFTKMPSAIADKIAGNTIIKLIGKVFGKNIAKMATSAKVFMAELGEKLIKKATDSVIGKAIKAGAKKAVSFIGLAIDGVMWFRDYRKALPDAAAVLNMQDKGVTQDFLEQNDLDDNVARAYATYKNGASLVLSVIGTIKQAAEVAAATGATIGTAGVAGVAAWPAVLLSATYWGIATAVVQMLFEFAMSFDSFLDTFTSIKSDINKILNKTSDKAKSLSNKFESLQKRIIGDLKKQEADADHSTQNVTTNTISNGSEMYNQKGGIEEDNFQKASAYAGTSSVNGSSAGSSAYSSTFDRIRNFGSKYTAKAKNLVSSAYNKITSALGFGGPKSNVGANASFDWSKVPTLAQLKGAKFTSNAGNNERAIKFMSMLLPIAHEMSQKHGIYVNPYLAMAQWALESNWGKKDSGNFNFWGIKGWGKPTEYWDGSVADVSTHEVINGVSTGMSQKFRAYKSAEDGIRDYFLFMSKRFPSIQTMGIEGLNHGVDGGKYATGFGYIPLVTKIYNQFDSGMKSSGFDMIKLQADIANNANIAYNASATGIDNPELAHLSYDGTKWTPESVVGRSGMKWATPLNNLGGTEIASVYGDRSDVAAAARARGVKMSGFHRGVDFVQGSGSPFFSIADGVVEKAGGGSVNNIIVRHANGIASEYMHGHPTVKVGDRVKAGQQIGKVGNVGTKGAHLHLGIFKGQSVKGVHNNYYDPFFELGLNPKNVRTRNSPENIRFLKSNKFSTNSENPEAAKAGKQMDSTGYMTKNGYNGKGGDMSADAIVNSGANQLVKELRDLKALVAGLIQVVSTGLAGSFGGVNDLLQGVIGAIKSKEKDDIMAQISTSRFN